MLTYPKVVKRLLEGGQSMSTSLLYHGFGIRGYEYVKTEYEGGNVIFTVRQATADLRCVACGSRQVIRRGPVHRQALAESIRCTKQGYCCVRFSLENPPIVIGGICCGLERHPNAKIGRQTVQLTRIEEFPTFEPVVQGVVFLYIGEIIHVQHERDVVRNVLFG